VVFRKTAKSCAFLNKIYNYLFDKHISPVVYTLKGHDVAKVVIGEIRNLYWIIWTR